MALPLWAVLATGTAATVGAAAFLRWRYRTPMAVLGWLGATRIRGTTGGYTGDVALADGNIAAVSVTGVHATRVSIRVTRRTPDDAVTGWVRWGSKRVGSQLTVDGRTWRVDSGVLPSAVCEAWPLPFEHLRPTSFQLSATHIRVELSLAPVRLGAYHLKPTQPCPLPWLHEDHYNAVLGNVTLPGGYMWEDSDDLVRGERARIVVVGELRKLLQELSAATLRWTIPQVLLAAADRCGSPQAAELELCAHRHFADDPGAMADARAVIAHPCSVLALLEVEPDALPRVDVGSMLREFDGAHPQDRAEWAARLLQAGLTLDIVRASGFSVQHDFLRECVGFMPPREAREAIVAACQARGRRFASACAIAELLPDQDAVEVLLEASRGLATDGIETACDWDPYWQELWLRDSEEWGALLRSAARLLTRGVQWEVIHPIAQRAVQSASPTVHDAVCDALEFGLAEEARAAVDSLRAHGLKRAAADALLERLARRTQQTAH